jgi:hypothetical protein
MKIYLSYWSQGYRKFPNEYILLLHKIACRLAKDAYGEKNVFMVCDDASSSYFKNCGFADIIKLKNVEQIGLEYSDYTGPWSLGKMFAYKQIAEIGEPFIHVDYDVFLFNKLPLFAEKADVIVQNIEWKAVHTYEADKLVQLCGNPHLLKDISIDTDYGFNLGIFGGNNLDFIIKYAENSIKFTLDPSNKYVMIAPNIFTHMWSRATTIEQLYLKRAADHYDVNVTCLFNVDKDQIKPTDEQCSKYKYVHVWGAKNQEYWKNRIYQIGHKLKLI